MHGEYKVPGGKLVVVDLDVVDGRLAEVRVAGDFFLEPDSALDAINAALNGLPVEAEAPAIVKAAARDKGSSAGRSALPAPAIGILILVLSSKTSALAAGDFVESRATVLVGRARLSTPDWPIRQIEGVGERCPGCVLFRVPKGKSSKNRGQTSCKAMTNRPSWSRFSNRRLRPKRAVMGRGRG